MGSNIMLVAQFPQLHRPENFTSLFKRPRTVSLSYKSQELHHGPFQLKRIRVVEPCSFQMSVEVNFMSVSRY